jgi:hypothetical protein
MFAIATLAFLAKPALAEAEIQFQTASPVVVFVDGRQTPVLGGSRRRARGLYEGWHEVTIRGPFGKVLYEGEVDLDDGTITYAEWASGELRITHIDSGSSGDAPEASSRAPLYELPEFESEELETPSAEVAVASDDALPRRVSLVSGDPVVLISGEQTMTVWVEDGVFRVASPPGVEVTLAVSPEPATPPERGPFVRPASPLAIPHGR